MNVIGRRRDGSLLGEDEDGALHIGHEKNIHLSRVELRTEIQADGDDEVLTRTETAGGIVIGKSSTRRSTFLENRGEALARGFVAAGSKKAAAEKAAADEALKEWEIEKTITRHEADYVDVLIEAADGSHRVEPRERTKTYLAWEKIQ